MTTWPRPCRWKVRPGRSPQPELLSSPRSELRGASTGTAELPADVTLTAVGDHKATFQMDGQGYATDVKLEGVYNLYNAAAALAVVRAVMQDNAAASKATAAANACAVSADELIAAVSARHAGFRPWRGHRRQRFPGRTAAGQEPDGLPPLARHASTRPTRTP